MKRLLCSLILSVFIGCAPANVPITDVTQVGSIVDAGVVPTSFNAVQKMQIRTDKLVVVIYGFAAVPIGVDAETYRRNGYTYLRWEGSDYSYLVLTGD